MVDAFPLFGFDLNDYEELFEEKLELFKIKGFGEGHLERRAPTVFHESRRGPGARGSARFPCGSAAAAMPNRQRARACSACRSYWRSSAGARCSCPGRAALQEAAARAGHDASTLRVATHSLGNVADTTSLAVEKYFAPTQASFNYFAKSAAGANTRARSSMPRAPWKARCTWAIPETVADKIVFMSKQLGFSGFSCICLCTMPHEDVMRAILLNGHGMVLARTGSARERKLKAKEN